MQSIVSMMIFFQGRMCEADIEISISYISSFKNQTDLKFLLESHDFQLHPSLGTCYTLSTPAKKNSSNPTSLSLASSRISLLGSSIHFLHLKILILRIIQAQFSSTLLSLLLIQIGTFSVPKYP